ncbi:MAG: hypothetical protein ACKPKO_10925, partial [Candidatus Fonsibacter sp.]
MDIAKRTRLKVLTVRSGQLVNVLQPADGGHQRPTIDKVNVHDPFGMIHDEWSYIVSRWNEPSFRPTDV